MESIKNNEDYINYYNFNENGSCISIGTKNGFKIILCDPYDNYYESNFNNGIGIVEMYKSSNILALTGCEKDSKFSDNQLIIWDDNKKEIFKELRLISKIRIVKIINDILFLVNDIKIYIFNFPELSFINYLDIYSYKNELISFCVKSEIKIAHLKNEMDIYIKHIKFDKNSKIKNFICNKEDDTPFKYLQFNTKGNILAAACEDKIYLYNTLDGVCTREISNSNLKHGSISYIKFNYDDNFLAISIIDDINNGNIYIFDVSKGKEQGLFDFFWNSDDKCYSEYNVKSGDYKFCFDKNDNIFIVTANGNFYKIFFDNKKKGEKCKLIYKKNLFI
jgi:WD40 repeat protein